MKKYLRRDYKQQNNMKSDCFFCSTRRLMDTAYSIV